MPDQAPNISVKPGDKGRLVYDKARRTIVADRPVNDIADRLRDRAAKAPKEEGGLLYDAADAICTIRSLLETQYRETDKARAESEKADDEAIELKAEVARLRLIVAEDNLDRHKKCRPLSRS